ncbi:anti-phage deoxyguanosine triphosphatase [Janthinobacterium lividum]
MDIWKKRQYDIDETTHADRDDFTRDRARVIHSAYFRRLQGKTQVLGLGESDFYRTRLTHSVEVAQIASGLVEYFRHHKELEEFVEYLPSPMLIEAVALAHDIGHPPFGHGGEVALNYSMRKSGGFEGNAQTLRICTKLGEFSEHSGLNLTRRALLGVLKYPATYLSTVNERAYVEKSAPLNIDSFKPPKCIFDCDSDSLKFVLDPFDAEKEKFQMVKATEGKHSKSLYKAFDTSILELADDIAYGVHDLEDAIALGLITERIWRAEVVAVIGDTIAKNPLGEKISNITDELFSENSKSRKKAISYLVGYFIRSCLVERPNNFTHPLLNLQATMNAAAGRELDVLKRFVVKNVIKIAEVQTLEYKGQQMIVRLFEAIANNPQRLLPQKYAKEYGAAQAKDRVICDYLAGTTDDYATRLYHKIFTPSTGSIFDRL